MMAGTPVFPGDQERPDAPLPSIRDYFASHAMQAMLVHHVRPIDPDDKIAARAYAVADAMLKARGR